MKPFVNFFLEVIKEYAVKEYKQYYSKFSIMVKTKQINGNMLNEIITPGVIFQLFYINLNLLTGDTIMWEDV